MSVRKPDRYETRVLSNVFVSIDRAFGCGGGGGGWGVERGRANATRGSTSMLYTGHRSCHFAPYIKLTCLWSPNLSFSEEVENRSRSLFVSSFFCIHLGYLLEQSTIKCEIIVKFKSFQVSLEN